MHDVYIHLYIQCTYKYISCVYDTHTDTHTPIYTHTPINTYIHTWISNYDQWNQIIVAFAFPIGFL